MIILKQRNFRIAAWCCLTVLTYLSLIPAEFEIRTGAPGGFEHLIAYFGTAFWFGLGYPIILARVAAGLVIYGGLMEVLQLVSPERYPSILDALSSGTGAVLGTLTATFAIRYLNRTTS